MSSLNLKNIYKVYPSGHHYFTLKDEGGEELFIAMALLPFGVDVGTKLKYENFEFEII